MPRIFSHVVVRGVSELIEARQQRSHHASRFPPRPSSSPQLMCMLLRGPRGVGERERIRGRGGAGPGVSVLGRGDGADD